MLNKSRHQSGTSTRQNDVQPVSYGSSSFFTSARPTLLTAHVFHFSPGASLRGPYKRWVPNDDYRPSESETDAPKQSSHKPRAHQGVPQAVPPTPYSNPAPPPSSSTRTSAQQHASSSRQHRSERTANGYSSESTVHVPSTQHKSGFSLFKHHSKDPKTPTLNITKGTSRPSILPTDQYPSKSTAEPPTQTIPSHTANSTPSSTDPSPRSSVDSVRNGNMSAPAAISQDNRKYAHAIWNPPTERRTHATLTSKKRGDVREEKKIKDRDREDLVAGVTEVFGIGKSNQPVQQLQPTVKPDDASSTKRTVSSTHSNAKTQESHSRSQPQSSRQRTAPPEVEYISYTSTSRHPHLSSSTTRTPAELQPRTQIVSEPISKSSTHASKGVPSSLPMPKPSHSRSAASPWPFNQGLPNEISKQQIPQPVSGWRAALPRLPTSSSSKVPVVSSTSNPLKQEESSMYVPVESGRASKSTTIPSSSKTSHRVSDMPVVPADPIETVYPNRLPLKENLMTPSNGDTGRGVQTTSTKTLPRSTRSTSQGPNLSSSVIQGIVIPPKADFTSIPMDHSSHSFQAYARVHTNSLRPGQTATSLSTLTPRLYSSSKPPTPPEPVVPEKDRPQAGLARNSLNDSSAVQEQPIPALLAASEKLHARRRVDSSASQFTGTVVRQAMMTDKPLPPPVPAQMPERPSTGSSTVSALNGYSHNSTSVTVSSSNAQGQTIWLPPGRHETNDTTKSFDATPGKFMSGTAQTAAAPAGIWTSSATETITTSDSLNGVGISSGFQSGSRSKPPTPPESDSYGLSNAVYSIEERHGAVSWVAKNSTFQPISNVDSEIDDMATPKPPPKATISEDTVILPVDSVVAPSMSTNKILPNLQMAPSSAAVTTPGAWTTGSKHAAKAFQSISDPFFNPSIPVQDHAQTRDSPPRQATFGTAPTPGAWTTKTGVAHIRSSIEATPKSTPPHNSSPPAETPSGTPPMANGTVGNSSSSSPNTSDVNTTTAMPSTSTRVPISGHPSTPAPIRPILRPMPPPLSISSTTPDTESLLTPSSLNNSLGPDSMLSPLPQATSTTTPVFIPQTPFGERESKSQKKSGGFFDFFKSKSATQSNGHEFWAPPSKDKDKLASRQEELVKESITGLSAAALLAKSSKFVTTPMPIPPSRPKSPKLFSPLRLFSKRHRTVSTASLDVLDGTTTNTVLNSPASSLRAETPGGPPSPSIRDAFLATQEWRDREADELILSGRKRQHRPGVTFDCPDDVAPVDYVRPRLVRVPRVYSASDDED